MARQRETAVCLLVQSGETCFRHQLSLLPFPSAHQPEHTYAFPPLHTCTSRGLGGALEQGNGAARGGGPEPCPDVPPPLPRVLLRADCLVKEQDFFFQKAPAIPLSPSANRVPEVTGRVQDPCGCGRSACGG